jgi:hypothetical protein
MGSRGRAGNLSCEWVVVVEVGDAGVVVRTAKYSETERSCRTGRQVLGGGVSCRTDHQVLGLSVVRPLFDDRRLVGSGPGPRQHASRLSPKDEEPNDKDCYSTKTVAISSKHMEISLSIRCNASAC